MKINLINVDNSFDPPLGLAYISSYLKKYGNFNNIKIIDKERNIIEKLKRENPDVIGISSLSQDIRNTKKLIEEIKKITTSPIIIGGPHITSLPNYIKYLDVDVGVIGEGEQTFLELIQNYEKNGSFNNNTLKNIDGIAFKENQKVTLTNKRKPIENIDSIPYPDRKLLKMKELYLLPRISFFPDQLSIVAGMFTSRGCPYRCVFCSSGKGHIRLNSPDYVVSEIKYLFENYKIDNIVLWDDLFTINKKRLKNIIELLKMEKIRRDIQFIVNGRANLIDEETCSLLKQMNVTRMSIGLESGSEKILNYLKNGTTTIEQNFNSLKLCKKEGIKVHGFFIIGSPMETEEDLKKTYELAINKNIETFSVFQLTPLPNTKIWDYAKEKGIIRNDINLNYLSVTGFKPELVMTENISAEKLKEWYDKLKNESNNKKIKFKFKLRYLKYLKFIFNKNFIKSFFKRFLN